MPIDKLNAEYLKYHTNERSACACQGDLSVDGLKPECVPETPLQQFVNGLYCEQCAIGSVPDEVAKPAAQAWKLSAEGWHEVEPDGSRSPTANGIASS